MLGLATAALGLIKLAPSIIEWIDGDEDESKLSKAAGVASKVARAITGEDNDDNALAAIQSNPELLTQYQAETNRLTLSLYREDTKRLQTVNETIRKEANSKDPYVRRWRPTFGYCMSIAWVVQFFGTIAAVIGAVFVNPEKSGEILKGLAEVNAATLGLWGIALSVIGVSVVQRSRDKQIAAGQTPPPGVLGSIAGVLTNAVAGTRPQ